MNYQQLHFEGMKLSKELKKVSSRLIEILGIINDNKIYLRHNEKNVFSYAEKYFEFSYRKTCSFLSLYNNSKNIPALKEEIKKGDIEYSKLSTILPALQKKHKMNSEQSNKEIKTLIEITKSTSRRKLEIIAKNIAPLPEARISCPPPKYLGEGKIECTARLSKEDYVLLEKAMNLISCENGQKVDLNSFLKIVSKRVIENKLKMGNKKAQIVVDKINEKEVVTTKKFGEIEIEKEKFETGSIALRRKESRSIPQKTKTYVYRRDGGKCICCSNVDKLIYHHIVAHSQNGSNEPSNITLICSDCHNLVHNSQIMLFREKNKIAFKYKNPLIKTFADYLFERKREEFLNYKTLKAKKRDNNIELNLFS